MKKIKPLFLLWHRQEVVGAFNTFRQARKAAMMLSGNFIIETAGKILFCGNNL